MRFYISSIDTQILYIRILANTFKQLLEFFVFFPTAKTVCTLFATDHSIPEDHAMEPRCA